MKTRLLWMLVLLVSAPHAAYSMAPETTRKLLGMQRSVMGELERYATQNGIAAGWVQYCRTETDRKRALVPKANEPPFTTNFNDVHPDLIDTFIELERNYTLHDGLLCLAGAKRTMSNR